MIDSGPNGLHGNVGNEVFTGVNFNTATGYQWSTISPTIKPPRPQRLATVPTNSYLNPDNEDYTVVLRYRTTKSYGNVVQKGQNTTPGGYFKLEQPGGFMTCFFKAGDGSQRAVVSPIATNDGQWHIIRCELTDVGVRLVIDGVEAISLAGPVANIANDFPLSIGGKTSCSQQNVDCDYFTGDIDYVRIEKGGTPPPPPPPTNCTVTRNGSTATLNWDPSGGTDVIRRNGSWLATPPAGTSTYVDSNSPPGAGYVIRTWSGGAQVDNVCGTSTTTTNPGSTTTTAPPPPTTCSYVRNGGTVTLTWVPSGGTDVLRRNGSWLATPPAGTSTYADSNSPAGATYLVRSWVGGANVDVNCLESSSTTTTTTTQPSTSTTTATTTTTTTTTTVPGSSTTTTVPTGSGCQVVVNGSAATITWVDNGGIHVLRRDGSWLATPGSGSTSYVDDPTPPNAVYELRSWVGGTRTDTTCTTVLG